MFINIERNHTMDDKPIETKEEQPVPEKKEYTPPTLTVYGKLADLTGGGLTGGQEPHQGANPSPLDKRS